MEIKPIRSDEEHAAALAEIESHWAAEPGTPEADRLDVLMALVRAYEDEHHAIPPPDPIDAIRFRLEQLGLDVTALQPIIGHRGRVSEILNRKRPLTLEMIRRLHVELGIPSDVLIAEYPLSRAG